MFSSLHLVSDIIIKRQETEDASEPDSDSDTSSDTSSDSDTDSYSESDESEQSEINYDDDNDWNYFMVHRAQLCNSESRSFKADCPSKQTLFILT